MRLKRMWKFIPQVGEKKRKQMSGVSMVLAAAEIDEGGLVLVPLKFTEEPFSQDARHGRGAILRCGVSHPTGVKFSWRMDGHHLSDSPRRFVDGRDLRFVTVDRRHDSGTFQCVARRDSTGDMSISRKATLNIKWIEAGNVMLQEPISEAELSPGSTLVLHCGISGNRMPSIQWFLDGLKLGEEDREADDSLRLDHDGTLTLRHAGPSDNGEFGCCGWNQVGTACSLQNFTLRIIDVSQPQVDIAPEDQAVGRNEGVSFHCSFSADPSPTLEWYYRDDVLLSNKSRFTIYPNGTLHIAQVKPRNLGEYRCLGLGVEGKTAEARAVLSFAEIGEMVPFESMIARSGERWSAHCDPPFGLPVPELWWEVDGKRLPSAGRIRANQGLLILEPAQPGDEGDYVCHAKNRAGHRQQHLPFIIATHPVWITAPVESRLPEGRPGILHCLASASPKPSVGWFKNGIDITEDSRFQVLFNGSLLILSVEVYDGTIYTCNTSTPAGSLSAAARVYVLENLKFTPQPLPQQCLELGKHGNLQCQATGRQKPNVTWSMEGEESLPHHLSQEPGRLFFPEVKMEDQGRYTCTASNELQGHIRATVNLQVAVFPAFTTEPQNTTVYHGNPAILHCQASGQPQPSIQWNVRGQILDPARPHDRIILLPNGSLIVHNVVPNDMGRYTCIAGNSCSIKHREVFLYTVDPQTALRPTEDPKPSPYRMIQTIGLSVGAAVAYIILVLGLMFYCKKRRQSRSGKKVSGSEETEAEHLNGETPQVNGEALSELKDEAAEEIGLMLVGVAKRNSVSDTPIIAAQQLQRITPLGEGHFGEVFLARLQCTGDAASADEAVVMVKVLGVQEEHAQAEFRREMALFVHSTHPNLIRLLGVVQEPKEMVLEYTDLGDLKQYLRLSRGDDDKIKMKPLTSQQKLSVCSQVARGMEYLSEMHCIHRDLATRNCLVSTELSIKIGCTALCKDVYSSEYFEHNQVLVPLRWLSPEALAGDFSCRSDVWAFGVLLWEIFTLGEIPYSKLSDTEVLRALQNSQLKLSTVKSCPALVMHLIPRCCAVAARERPSFSVITEELASVQLDTSV
uniref:Inactive tyrosine-protein kinase 7 n=1 Tax=Eptatretus burgeri TaxID=7764 RepID=A0A8C4QKB9_EPTBU